MEGKWEEIVDKDVLYSAMGKLHDEYAHALNLNYGELDAEKKKQYWSQDGQKVNQLNLSFGR